MKFWKRQREKGRGVKKVCRERSSNVFLSISYGPSPHASFTQLQVQGFGGQDASAESINVLLCLFVCPQSPRKPQEENENGERERITVSEEMMREKHHCKLLKTV